MPRSVGATWKLGLSTREQIWHRAADFYSCRCLVHRRRPIQHRTVQLLHFLVPCRSQQQVIKDFHSELKILRARKLSRVDYLVRLLPIIREVLVFLEAQHPIQEVFLDKIPLRRIIQVVHYLVKTIRLPILVIACSGRTAPQHPMRAVVCLARTIPPQLQQVACLDKTTTLQPQLVVDYSVRTILPRAPRVVGCLVKIMRRHLIRAVVFSVRIAHSQIPPVVACSTKTILLHPTLVGVCLAQQMHSLPQIQAVVSLDQTRHKPIREVVFSVKAPIPRPYLALNKMLQDGICLGRSPLQPLLAQV